MGSARFFRCRLRWRPRGIPTRSSVVSRSPRVRLARWVSTGRSRLWSTSPGDPRWGRIVEGAGEDPYLGAVVAAAQVRGFQGGELGAPDRIIAGPKHFAGYGAALGGRDYDEVDLSDSELWNVYFPPFKSAIEAGAGNVMTAYMPLNGIPATGNRWLFTEVLRETWGFAGFVVSDANAVRSLVTHGFRGRPDGRRCPRGQRRCGYRDGVRGARVRPPARGAGVGCGESTGGGCERPACAGSEDPDGPLRCAIRGRRTARARCSPIRHTAKWPVLPRSGLRCFSATRETCYHSTLAA